MLLRCLNTLFILLFSFLIHTQANNTDSLKLVFLKENVQAIEAGLLICDYYETLSADSMLLFAKQTLSLAQKLQLPEKEALAYRKLADAYYYLDSLNASNTALIKGAEMAEKQGLDKSFIGSFYNDMGYNISTSGRFIDAFTYFEKALSYFISAGNKEEEANVYNNIAVAYFNLSDYQQALHYYQKAYSIDTLIKNTTGEGSSLNNMGRVFVELKKYETGIAYYKKALQIALLQNDKYLQAIRTNNIGMALQLIGQHDSAIVCFNSALELDKIIGNENAFATRHNNLALAYQAKKDYSKALIHFSQAILYYKRCNDLYNLGMVYANIGLLLLNDKKITQAYTYLHDAYKISLLFHALPMREKALNGLYTIEKTKNNFREANIWMERLAETRDSILSIEVLKHAEDLEKVYQTSQKDAQIKELEQVQEVKNLQLVHRKQQRNLAAIIAIFAVLSAIILLFLQRKLALKNKQLAALNQTLNKLFGIISHDLKSAVSAYQSTGKILTHYIHQNQPDKLNLIANEVTNNSNKLAFLLDNLLKWSLSNLKNFHPQKTVVHVKQIADEVIDLFEVQAKEKNTLLINEIADEMLAFADEQHVHFILRNLVSNAIKFTENGKVTLKSMENEHFIAVHVVDTGTGIDKHILSQLFQLTKSIIGKGTRGEHGSGLGLYLVNEFVEKNDGKMEVFSESGKGTTFVFYLPLHN